MNSFLYLVRRETWEHRALYRAPVITMLVLAAVSVLLTAKGLIGGDIFMAFEHASDEFQSILTHYKSTASPVMLWALFSIITIVAIITAAFYLLDCLYAERKNRTIMFWKSLPISDTATVMSKLVAAIVVLPLFTVAAALAGWLFLQVLVIVIMAIAGVNGLTLLWQPGNLFGGLLVTLEASVGLMLWYLPLFGWLMLVSAWAKRSALMWAVLPPLAMFYLEWQLFGSKEFLELLIERLVGFHAMFTEPSEIFDFDRHQDIPEFMMGSASEVVHLSSLLQEPGLYGGIAVAALFVTGAIFLRRYRNEG